MLPQDMESTDVPQQFHYRGGVRPAAWYIVESVDFEYDPARQDCDGAFLSVRVRQGHSCPYTLTRFQMVDAPEVGQQSSEALRTQVRAMQTRFDDAIASGGILMRGRRVEGAAGTGRTPSGKSYNRMVVDLWDHDMNSLNLWLVQAGAYAMGMPACPHAVE